MPVVGDVVAGEEGSYRVEASLGQGAFGAVLRVVRLSDGATLAMKVEPVDVKKRMLVMEVKVLANASAYKSAFFTSIYDKGEAEGKYTMLVMQLVSTNLWDLREARDPHQFSMNTSLRIAEQTLAGIRDLHEMGFLHRDIKPPNFACGREEDGKQQTIFVLDFGLARKYRDHDGALRKVRETAPFRGTTRYASVESLSGHEQARRDDVEAWYYMMLEWMTGALPWRIYGGAERDKVREMKVQLRDRAVFNDAFATEYPRKHLFKLLTYIAEMTFASIPDYFGMYRILRSVAQKRKIPDTAPLDWVPATRTYDGPDFVHAGSKGTMSVSPGLLRSPVDSTQKTPN